MANFKYRSKGNNDEDWNYDEIEALSKEDAIKKLDQIYGVVRDNNGNPKNTDYVQVELVKG